MAQDAIGQSSAGRPEGGPYEYCPRSNLRWYDAAEYFG